LISSSITAELPAEKHPTWELEAVPSANSAFADEHTFLVGLRNVGAGPVHWIIGGTSHKTEAGQSHEAEVMSLKGLQGSRILLGSMGSKALKFQITARSGSEDQKEASLDWSAFIRQPSL
jgi:hypothetical protein